MAQGITYNIAGKYNPKGEKAAINGINKLTGAAKKFNAVVGGFVIGKIIQGITKVVSGSTEEFIKNSKALANFNTSVQNNMKLTAGAAERLQATLDAVSTDGLFGGDELNNAAAMAAQMGLNEEQINNVMEAATDLAASGIMPLDQATKTLSATYGGNLGQLKKLYPELGNLTKEELENGKAVEILESKYDGFRETMANTFSGQDTKFQDAFGHLQEAVGGIFQGLKFGMEGGMLEPLHNAAEFLEEHRDKILQFCYNLPSVMKIIVQNVWEMIKKTFTGPGFMNLIQYIGGSIGVMAKSLFPMFLEGVKTLMGTIKDLVNGSIGNLWRNLQDVLGALGNKFIEVINKTISTLLQTPGVKQIYEFATGNKAANFEAIKFRFDTNHKKDNVPWQETKKSIGERFDKLLETYKKSVKDGIEGQKENLADFISFYDDITSKSSEEVKKAMMKELPQELQEAIKNSEIQKENAAKNPGTTDTPIETDNSGITESLSLMDQFKSKISEVVNIFGEVGMVIDALMSSNIVGLIITLITKFVAALQNASGAFATFMNYISTVFQVVAEKVAPIIDKIFMPFLNCIFSIAEIISSALIPLLTAAQMILTPILNMISMLITMLAPILNVVGKLLTIFIKISPVLNIFAGAMKILADLFLFIYNKIFVPVVNFLLKIVSAIGNFFIGMYNTVVRILRSINIFGWRPFGDMGYADEINYDSIKLDKIEEQAYNEGDGHGGEYMGDVNTGGTTNSSSGHSASYTAARDININIEVGHIVGNDGMREFSLMIRDEIQQAEALGR